MDNIPYEEWCGYLHTLLEKYDVTDGLVLELGCGTGTMTELLADCGYDMIGVDNSADMLEIALERRNSPEKTFYICSRICGNLSCTVPCGRL